MDIKKRQETERSIARRFIQDAIRSGCSIDVQDGEEVTLRASTDVEAILKAMFTTDEDRLYLCRDGKYIGWVYFVYGNDGWDVINDYTVNLEGIMAMGTNKLIDSLESRFE